MSNFKWGNRSLSNLYGIHHHLRQVADRALEVTSQDMTVIEGLRSPERQAQLVSEGKSQTMNSRHLTGHAIDVAPWVNGSVSWDWEYFYAIGDAFIKASKELDVPIRWGANWRIHDLRNWEETGIELARAYPGNFPDGPHFEIPRGFGYD